MSPSIKDAPPTRIVHLRPKISATDPAIGATAASAAMGPRMNLLLETFLQDIPNLDRRATYLSEGIVYAYE